MKRLVALGFSLLMMGQIESFKVNKAAPQ